MKTAEQVWQALEPTVTRERCEIVDVEFKKLRDALTLTLYIDMAGGVSLDDCERVHRAVDPVLDALDPTDDKAYVFNVSSPGLDRPFKRQRDFERNYGKEVELKLYAPVKGKKVYEGVLKQKRDGAVIIEADGKELTFESNQLAYCRPLVKFE